MTISSDQDKLRLIEKIRNLMNKTTANGASEAEASSAVKMAHRLMAEHNIAMASVQSNANQDLFGEELAWHGTSLDGEYIPAIHIVERTFPVRAKIINVKQKDGPRVGVAITLFGDPVNVQAAVWTLKYLGITIKGLWNRYRVKTGAGRSDRGTFMHGIAVGFVSKIEQSNQEVHKELPGSSTALAVIQRKVDQAFADANPKLEFTPTKLQGSEDAFREGYKEGRDLTVNRPLAAHEAKSLGGEKKQIGQS